MEKSIVSGTYSAVINRLVQRRKIQKIRQIDLAKKLGKTQSFVSKYEKKERRIDVGEFIEIAVALDIDPAAVIKEVIR